MRRLVSFKRLASWSRTRCEPGAVQSRHMRTLPTVIIPLVFVGLASASLLPVQRARAQDRVPVLVELFTAEGCSSCPPADRLLEAMLTQQPARNAMLVGIGEHVDYWNNLGWKDAFSSALFTQRQQQYGANIYTPQMVVDGAAAFVGSDAGAARSAIDSAAKAPHGQIALRVEPAERDIEVVATVESLPRFDPADRADLLVAVVEDGLRSDVKRGENAGRVLTHAAVARLLTLAGQIDARGGIARTRVKVPPEWQRARLHVVAFVQLRHSRRVLATTSTAVS